MAQPYEVLKFEGDVFMFRINADESETAILDRPIEATGSVFAFEEGEERTVLSKGRDRYNQALYSEQDPGQARLNLTLVEFPDDIKALLFAGELTTASEAGAAITDESQTAVAQGNILRLAHGNIAASPAPVVKIGATTLVAGTDYTIDRTFGVLKVLEGGDIEAGDALLVSYTYTATTVTTIAGGIKPQQRFRIAAYLKNRPTSRDAFLDVWDVKLGRTGETDLLGAEPLKIELTGICTVPAGKSSPYEYIERKSAA